jgi:DNA replication protein DnaC
MSDDTTRTPSEPKPDPELRYARTDGFVTATVSACGHCHKGSVFVEDEHGNTSVKSCPKCGPLSQQAAALNLARLPVDPPGANLSAFTIDRPGDPPKVNRGDGVFVVNTEAGTMLHPAQYRAQALEAAVGFCNAVITANALPVDGAGLLMAGPPGVGKSHLLIGILRRLAMRAPKIKTRYASAGQVMADCRRSLQAQKETQKLVDDLVLVPLLALDELGKGRATDWEVSVADEIITRRYEAGRATLYATNYSLERDPLEDDLDALANRIGGRAFSRAMHRNRVLVLVGSDQRFEGRAA